MTRRRARLCRLCGSLPSFFLFGLRSPVFPGLAVLLRGFPFRVVSLPRLLFLFGLLLLFLDSRKFTQNLHARFGIASAALELRFEKFFEHFVELRPTRNP